MKYWVELFYFLCIWNAKYFAVGETKPSNVDISEEIYSCDYTRFETELERMKLQTAINHDTHMRQQKELFGNLERKLNELSSKFDGIQDKVFEGIKSNTDDLKDFIKVKSQPQVLAVTPVVDDKILIMIDIKEKMERHDRMLNKILSNQNDTKQLINEIDLENHSQRLQNTVSDKLESLQKINEKLQAIEDNSIPKIEQLKFYQNIQQHLNATEIYLRDENHSLTIINQAYPTSCADFNVHYCAINKCLIKNHLYGPAPFFVACDNSVEGGGWTVIQRRINGAVDFYRDWSEYKSGFGDIDSEFFIGLEKLHGLTSTLKPVELLIQIQDFNNTMKYAKYNDFKVGNETENYKLIKLGSYVGDAGDSFGPHVGYNFTTKDRDNDSNPRINCAKYFTAAWWYLDCYYCNLNGKYYQHPTKYYNETINNSGINWNAFHDLKYSLKSVQMLIRPRKR